MQPRWKRIGPASRCPRMASQIVASSRTFWIWWQTPQRSAIGTLLSSLWSQRLSVPSTRTRASSSLMVIYLVLSWSINQEELVSTLQEKTSYTSQPGAEWTSRTTTSASLEHLASCFRGALPLSFKIFHSSKHSKGLCMSHNGSTRYGLREGFSTKNIDVKHAHDVAMAFQRTTPISIHENVPDYEED